MIDDVRIEKLPVVGAVVEVYTIEADDTLAVLKEAVKKLQRAVLRYEAGFDRDIGR